MERGFVTNLVRVKTLAVSFLVVIFFLEVTWLCGYVVIANSATSINLIILILSTCNVIYNSPLIISSSYGLVFSRVSYFSGVHYLSRVTLGDDVIAVFGFR